jgi:hypothetical protein
MALLRVQLHACHVTPYTLTTVQLEQQFTGIIISEPHSVAFGFYLLILGDDRKPSDEARSNIDRFFFHRQLQRKNAAWGLPKHCLDHSLLPVPMSTQPRLNRSRHFGRSHTDVGSPDVNNDWRAGVIGAP